MKRESVVILSVFLMISAILLGSCHTATAYTVKPEEAVNIEKIGSEQVDYMADYSGFWISKAAKELAHIKLMEKAKAEFPGQVVDVIDIKITMSRVVKKKEGQSTFHATGTVVVSNEAGTERGELIIASKNLETVIPVIVGRMIDDSLPKKSIAIVNIAALNKALSNLTDIVLDLLTENLQASGYDVIDRTNLAAIRAEKALQASGDISEDSAVSIGQELGAQIVVTGTLSGIGTNRRIRISALDVLTAKTLFSGSEKF